MAKESDSKSTDNIEIAEEYERKFGKNKLCDFLKARLLVEAYDDDKDVAPLIINNLNIGVVYTTNQDNIYEKCAEKYGRPFRQIVTLEDLGESAPGELLYIKYHGALDQPDSVIFTQSSYSKRIADIDHFLNIRMRSDLLAKSFLFIGYSFRDPNVVKLFEELNSAFKGKLPKSYLVAYSYSPELEELNRRYGITIIDPTKEMGEVDKKKAFTLFLSKLLDLVVQFKAQRETSDLFRPAIPHSVKAVSKYEIDSVEAAIEASDFETGLNAFRIAFDIASIPEQYHERVAKLFVSLARRCETKQQSDLLNGAAFNLHLNPRWSLEVFAAISATAEKRGYNGQMQIFLPIVKGINTSTRPLAVARAIEMLREWNVEITDAFRQHVTGWVQGYKTLPPDIHEHIKALISSAWTTPSNLENPIRYWERVGNFHIGPKAMTYEDIVKNLMANIPKSSTKPYEE